MSSLTANFGSSYSDYRPWEYDILVKILIVGNSGVGKSCLLVRYSDDEFYESHLSTIGVDFKIKTQTLQDHRVAKIQLWDTAGQERFGQIVSGYYRSSNGIMIVFDLTDEKSFREVAKWLDQIAKYGSENTPMVLVGNKSDLVAKRVIDRRVAEEFAKNMGMEYIETSAKNSNGVDVAFDKMLQAVVKSQNYIDNNPNTKKKTDSSTTVIGPGLRGNTTVTDSSNNSCCWK
ncbi:hypothetical protein C9374_006482 [Naegleria lovaniensis]|uniref:Rab family small GTPase n=1 Tax=Naegleria lovaniensis TaxID=51637 RepID=A0AA88GNX0_NAELO|nr:uncharacterized protein C9374_006482 [Naegleria lovaniensis]KAG2381493.1 hypothetical protein C9374_006482 [Naegleria lovaniensis]